MGLRRIHTTDEPALHKVCKSVEVFDRTPDYEGNNRDREVRDWLTAHGGMWRALSFWTTTATAGETCPTDWCRPPTTAAAG